MPVNAPVTFPQILALILLLSLAGQGMAQTLNPRIIGTLPAELAESSGLETGAGRTLWSHNDSDNPAELFQIDSTGRVVRKVVVENASNLDWEDLARDDAGSLYVGDIGNNGNARQDLRIYKIAAASLLAGDTVQADTISLRYADQTAFPPPSSRRHYDVEALLWANDSLHIFTKNRTSPFDGWVYHYQVPDQPGDYTLSRVDSFRTGGNRMETYWVTAADISPDRQRMVLLSSDKMWVFACYPGVAFFRGFGLEVGLTTLTQKEAVVFVNDRRLILSDERFIITGGRLYDVDIAGLPALRVNLGLDRMLAGDSIVLQPAMPPETRFRWSTGATTPAITVDEPGEYSVEVALHGCVARDTILVQGPSDLMEDEAPLSIEIGPNPFAQSTRIAVTIPVPGPVEVSLIDSSGKRVYAERRLFTQAGEHRFVFQPSSVAPGSYNLILRQDSYRISGRIIKE